MGAFQIHRTSAFKKDVQTRKNPSFGLLIIFATNSTSTYPFSWRLDGFIQNYFLKLRKSRFLSVTWLLCRKIQVDQNSGLYSSRSSILYPVVPFCLTIFKQTAAWGRKDACVLSKERFRESSVGPLSSVPRAKSRERNPKGDDQRWITPR